MVDSNKYHYGLEQINAVKFSIKYKGSIEIAGITSCVNHLYVEV